MTARIEFKINKDPYRFDKDCNGFPTFTNKNKKLLNALLHYDSNYSNSFDLNDCSTYAGLLARDGVPTEREDIERIVKSIDTVNSTHLSAQGPKGGNQGVELTVAAIGKIKNLSERLKKRDDTLINFIATAGGKNNFSFASKFCAYTALFAKDIRLDNYCIFDSVVAEVLPYYVYLYASDEIVKKLLSSRRGKLKTLVTRLTKDCHDYQFYRQLINSVICGINKQCEIENCTYQDFDLLVWYYFKGKEQKVDKALSCIVV